MSTVPSGTRFIGISERVNLTERKSALLNSGRLARLTIGVLGWYI